MAILKILLQLILVLFIIATIKMLKDHNRKYSIESYLISILIYMILIIILL